VNERNNARLRAQRAAEIAKEKAVKKKWRRQGEKES